MAAKSKTIPLSDEAFEIVRGQLQRHRELFGCEPGKRDKVFFDIAHNEDASSMERAKIEAMLSASDNYALIYASMICDRIVTEDNSQFLDPDELEEWNAAFDQGEALLEEGYDLRAIICAQVFPERGCEGMRIARDQISALGYIRSHGWSPKVAAATKGVASSLIFQAQQCARLFCSASHQQFYPELVCFARTIFEIALRIEVLKSDPALVGALIALSGLRTGEYKYQLRANGTLDSRTAVHCGTGKTIDIGRSNRSLAERSAIPELEDIYGEMFPFLSSVVHPNAAYAEGALKLSDDDVAQYEIGFLALNSSLNHFIAATLASGMLPGKSATAIRYFVNRANNEVRGMCRNRFAHSAAPEVEACRRLTEGVDRYLLRTFKTVG